MSAPGLATKAARFVSLGDAQTVVFGGHGIPLSRRQKKSRGGKPRFQLTMSAKEANSENNHDFRIRLQAAPASGPFLLPKTSPFW